MKFLQTHDKFPQRAWCRSATWLLAMSFVASGAARAQKASSPAAAVPAANSAASDKPARELKVCALKFASADDTCRLLSTVLDASRDTQGVATTLDWIKLTSDPRTNSVLVQAPAQQAEAVANLLAQLDYSRSSDAIAARLLSEVVLDDAKKKAAAYLGVGVESPDETLRAQLDLPAGTGLVVSYIDPDGPAHEFIHPHDVLQRIDDQLLVNAEQLATLVRLHKVGEEVKVTVLRQAKPVVLAIKLGQKDVAEAHAPVSHLSHFGYNVTLTPSEPEKMHILHDNMDLGGDGLIQTRTGPITFEDPTTTAVMFRTANEGFLIAFDHQDKKLIFCGPVDNVQEWNALPEALRQKLASWRELLLDHKELGIETRELRTPVLSDVPVIGRLFINRTAPTLTTQPAGSGN